MTPEELTAIRERDVSVGDLLLFDGQRTILHDRRALLAEVDRLRAENERLREALNRINDLACYGSEENIDSRAECLLAIGANARDALNPEQKP